MQRETYDYLWDRFEECMVKVENSFSDKIKSEFDFHRAHASSAYKEVILRQYENIRDDLKKILYQNDSDLNDRRLDQHKIAACFSSAFIIQKAFVFSINNSTPRKMIRSNYELAYRAGLAVIYLFLLDYYRNSDPAVLDKILNTKKLFVPETTQKHDEFNLGQIKRLALTDYYGKDLDLLGYSDMFYWIEHYNRQRLEMNVEIIPYSVDNWGKEIFYD